jgi:hypothetical protein
MSDERGYPPGHEHFNREDNPSYKLYLETKEWSTNPTGPFWTAMKCQRVACPTLMQIITADLLLGPPNLAFCCRQDCCEMSKAGTKRGADRVKEIYRKKVEKEGEAAAIGERNMVAHYEQLCEDARKRHQLCDGFRDRLLRI